MTVSHAVTMNGRISTALKPRAGRSTREELQDRLDLLDGTERFSLWLWRLPEGVPFDRIDLEAWPREFIQCAGGLSGRFTCEIRRIDADGNTRHDVIGRSTQSASAVSNQAIRWAEHTTNVRENEVLDREALGELFGTYLVSSEIPEGYETRPASGS
jgi:hypothetical protein